jgi:phosphatidylglycerol:prolipoprotein diacylglycerol transferase
LPSIIFQSPGAVLFSLGTFTVRWYGIMIAIGFLIALHFGQRLASKYKIAEEQFLNLCLVTFISGVLGARLYFVFLNWHIFALRPQDILATWQGGLSIHGGIVGGLIAGFIFCSVYKLPFLALSDIWGATLPLGQAIGRWGNFFNSEAYGHPVATDAFLKVYIPIAERPMPYIHDSFFQPTFFYESVWDFSIFLLLYFYLFKKLRAYPGTTFLVYLIAYSIGRLIIEPMRLDSIMFHGMAVPSLVSAITLLLSCLGLMYIILTCRENPPNKQNNKS